MATNYPGSLDTYPALVDGVDILEGADQNNVRDAIEALQAKVGVNSSAVSSSHDYKLAKLVGEAATADDSESNAMLKSHAYLAQTAGFVTVFASTDNRMQLYVGATNDPAGAGTLVNESHATNTDRINVHAFVPNGRYFEVTLSSETPTIIWTGMVNGGAKPVDQD